MMKEKEEDDGRVTRRRFIKVAAGTAAAMGLFDSSTNDSPLPPPKPNAQQVAQAEPAKHVSQAEVAKAVDTWMNDPQKLNFGQGAFLAADQKTMKDNLRSVMLQASQEGKDGFTAQSMLDVLKNMNMMVVKGLPGKNRFRDSIPICQTNDRFASPGMPPDCIAVDSKTLLGITAQKTTDPAQELQEQMKALQNHILVESEIKIFHGVRKAVDQAVSTLPAGKYSAEQETLAKEGLSRVLLKTLGVHMKTNQAALMPDMPRLEIINEKLTGPNGAEVGSVMNEHSNTLRIREDYLLLLSSTNEQERDLTIKAVGMPLVMHWGAKNIQHGRQEWIDFLDGKTKPEELRFNRGTKNWAYLSFLLGWSNKEKLSSPGEEESALGRKIFEAGTQKLSSIREGPQLEDQIAGQLASSLNIAPARAHAFMVEYLHPGGPRDQRMVNNNLDGMIVAHNREKWLQELFDQAGINFMEVKKWLHKEYLFTKKDINH